MENIKKEKDNGGINDWFKQNWFNERFQIYGNIGKCQ